MWKCSKCDAMNEENEKICPSCGEPCPEDVSEEASEVLETDEVFEVAEAEDTQVEEVAEYEEDVVTFAEGEETTFIPTTWVCKACGKECEGDACENCSQARPEDSNIVDFVPKKTSNKVIALIAAVAAVVLLTAGIFTYYFFNRYVEGTGEDGIITWSDVDDTCDGIFGNDVALKIGGVEVPATIFESYLTNKALYYQQDFCYDETGNLNFSKLDNFKWTDIADKETGETHAQKIIADTINDCVSIYSVIALGRAHDVKPSQEDLNAIDEQIEAYKKQYGDSFQTVLKHNGYDSVEQFIDILKIDVEMNAIYTDLEANPDKYIAEDTSIYNIENPSVISAKHILIKVDEVNGVDDKAAKKKANEVLKKIKAGENFDELIAEYNEDEGQPEEGYSFAKGQMVAEFEDAAFALKIGEVSGLVKTEFGYHIIKRVAYVTDVLTYAQDSAKVIANKSFLNDLKIKADLKALQEETKKQQSAAQAEVEE